MWASASQWHLELIQWCRNKAEVIAKSFQPETLEVNKTMGTLVKNDFNFEVSLRAGSDLRALWDKHFDADQFWEYLPLDLPKLCLS